MWGDQVTVVSSDMREWNAPEKADILVSELLGSFGDNELSPECLDGAQKFLKGNMLKILFKTLMKLFLETCMQTFKSCLKYKHVVFIRKYTR